MSNNAVPVLYMVSCLIAQGDFCSLVKTVTRESGRWNLAWKLGTQRLRPRYRLALLFVSYFIFMAHDVKA